MSIINNNLNTITSLFNSLPTNPNNVAANMMLTDYASLKSGSYGKLLKAYYKEVGTDSSDKKTSSVGKKEVSVSESNAAAVKGMATTLAKTTDALSDSALFQKKSYTRTKDDGSEETYEDYDREAIYQAVSAFAKSYNDTLSTVADKGSDRVVKQALNMEYATATNTRLLGRVGITIDKDNSLKVDKAKLDKADIGTLTTLFGPSGALSNSIHAKASLISSTAGSNAKSSYKADGNYLDKLMSGSMYNGLV